MATSGSHDERPRIERSTALRTRTPVITPLGDILRGAQYILGARERSDAIVRKIVLEIEDPFTPLLIECKAGKTQLFVKQVKIEGKRYTPRT